jgi:hypothetical protein
LHQVLPGARYRSAPALASRVSIRFPIKSLEVPYPGVLGERGLMGEFFGITDPDDPARRLMVVINYNMDIGDYMGTLAERAVRGGADQRGVQVRYQLPDLRPHALVRARFELRPARVERVPFGTQLLNPVKAHRESPAALRGKSQGC